MAPKKKAAASPKPATAKRTPPPKQTPKAKSKRPATTATGQPELKAAKTGAGEGGHDGVRTVVTIIPPPPSPPDPLKINHAADKFWKDFLMNPKREEVLPVSDVGEPPSSTGQAKDDTKTPDAATTQPADGESIATAETLPLPSLVEGEPIPAQMAEEILQELAEQLVEEDKTTDAAAPGQIELPRQHEDEDGDDGNGQDQNDEIDNNEGINEQASGTGPDHRNCMMFIVLGYVI